MSNLSFIKFIKSDCQNVCNTIDSWFLEPKGVRIYPPKSGGWSISEILEHIYLTNKYLLILIDKGHKKAIKNLNNQNLTELLSDYNFNTEKLNAIGIHRGFEWNRPAHMEPEGNISKNELRSLINSQFSQCMEYLDQMPNGEGLLYKTTMTVNSLGKINVYEYIYFLIMHGRRHLKQMELCRKEYLS